MAASLEVDREKMREESGNAAQLSSAAASLALLPAARHNMQDNLLGSIPVVDVIVWYRRNFQVRLRPLKCNRKTLQRSCLRWKTEARTRPLSQIWNYGIGALDST